MDPVNRDDAFDLNGNIDSCRVILTDLLPKNKTTAKESNECLSVSNTSSKENMFVESRDDITMMPNYCFYQEDKTVANKQRTALRSGSNLTGVGSSNSLSNMHEKERSKIVFDRNNYESGRKESQGNNIGELKSWSPKKHHHNESIDNYISRGDDDIIGAEQYERLYEMYEMGKSKIVTDRERYEKKKKEMLPENYLPKYSTVKRDTRSGSRTPGERQMRLSEMHEMGKSKIVNDRERHAKKVGSKGLPRIKKSSSTAQYNRLNEMYLKGKDKLIFDRECQKSQKKDKSSSKRIPIISKQNRLYDLSKKKQIDGKKRREEIEKVVKSKRSVVQKPIIKIPSKTIKGKTAIDSSNYTPRYIRLNESGKSKVRSHKITPIKEEKTAPKEQSDNGTCLRLYRMSKHMQEDGKDRREGIKKRVQLCRVTIFSEANQEYLRNW